MTNPVAGPGKDHPTGRAAHEPRTRQSSPLTDPGLAADARAKSQEDHGDAGGDATARAREDERIAQRPDF